jgi:hypothetical protein
MFDSGPSDSNTSGTFPPFSWAVIRRQDCCCGITLADTNRSCLGVL